MICNISLLLLHAACLYHVYCVIKQVSCLWTNNWTHTKKMKMKMKTKLIIS